MPAVEAIAKTLFRAYEIPEGRGEGEGGCASRFRRPGIATEECWGAPLHQLVHNPETGERPVHIPWPEEVFFFFFSAR